MLCPFPCGGAGSPSNTMWHGLRPISISSGVLIHPTVWPKYTNIADRQDRTGQIGVRPILTDRCPMTGQRSDSIVRTVLQTVAQKEFTAYKKWPDTVYSRTKCWEVTSQNYLHEWILRASLKYKWPTRINVLWLHPCPRHPGRHTQRNVPWKEPTHVPLRPQRGVDSWPCFRSRDEVTWHAELSRGQPSSTPRLSPTFPTCRSYSWQHRH